MIHMWALPYTFKNFFIDSMVRVVQLGFSLILLVALHPTVLQPVRVGLLAGAGVGAACMLFHIFWNRGSLLKVRTIDRSFLASQAVLLLFHAPTEELFYRGVFFTILDSIWGPLTALVISTALSAMIAVVSSRRQGLWRESAFVGLLCCLGYYWTQCVWAAVLIRMLNDLGFVTLTEQRNIFKS